MKSIKEVMLSRHSCRKFCSDKLNSELVREMLDFARLSPSSCGLEPWRMMIISDPCELKELSVACNSQPQVAECSHAVILIARNDLRVGEEYLERTVRRRANTPQKYEVAMNYFRAKFVGLDDEALMNYATKQLYILAANIANIAEGFDVRSCIMTGFDAAALEKFCALEAKFRPAIVVVLGRGEPSKYPHTRYELDEILISRGGGSGKR